MPRVLAAGRGVRPSPEDAHPGGPPGSAASTGRGRGAGGHRAGAHGGTCAGDKFRQKVKTTASGHTACASVSTRSARPTWPPRVISSAANHTSRPSSAPAATAETAGRGPPGTQDPRLSPPSGQTVRAIKPIAAQNACAGEPPLAGSGGRRDQYAGYTTSDQDEPSGDGGRPERQARYDIADAHRQQHERHYPPVGGTIGR